MPDYGRLPGNQSAAERDGRQIDPMIQGIFADKRQSFHQDTTASRVTSPALAGQLKGRLGGGFGGHLHDGEMWDVWPLFLEGQRFGIQLAVKCDHAGGPGLDADVNGGSDGDERFDVSQGNFKGFLGAANPLQNLQCGTLGVLQTARRENAEMGCEVRKIGMELAPKVFNELPCGILEIRHQRVTRLLHTGEKLYALEAGHVSKKNDSVTSER